jgi:hypothetical protein
MLAIPYQSQTAPFLDVSISHGEKSHRTSFVNAWLSRTPLFSEIRTEKSALSGANPVMSGEIIR